MKTFEVTVTSIVKVTLDERAFTPEFFAEYERHFNPYGTIERHAEHIGQLAAREMFSFRRPDEFVEGYGEIGHFGIKAEVTDVETDAIELDQARA